MRPQQQQKSLFIRSSSSTNDLPFSIEISALIDQHLNTIEQDYVEYLTVRLFIKETHIYIFLLIIKISMIISKLPSGRLERKIRLAFDDETNEYFLTKKETIQKVKQPKIVLILGLLINNFFFK